ncbi:MAG: dephospho-CoA kinase [Alphaproteobacteria bacterium]|nr:dephospho-CoA kinase [Alphaproteobacteria bacterium]
MFVLGLTGSIGMGKTTTAALFAAEGIPVFDSDATVHELYDEAAAPLIEAAFPGTTQNGVANRRLLAQRVLTDPAALKKLEAIVHPLVDERRRAFVADEAKKGSLIVVFDVPLLFETGLDQEVDAVVLVTAPEAVQKARVIGRPSMTLERFSIILARQMPDAEKRVKSHFIIDTSGGFSNAKSEVRGILRALAGVKNKDCGLCFG